MLFWMSGFDARERVVKGVLCLAAIGASVLVAPSAEGATTRSTRVSALSGVASDFILEQDVGRRVVEGGSFLGFGVGMDWQRRDPGGFAFTGRVDGWSQNFLESAPRRMTSVAASAEWLKRRGNGLRTRAKLIGSGFDDTSIASVRRFAVGGELALGKQGDGWLVETTGGAFGRTYPHLEIADDAGNLSTFGELNAFAGIRALGEVGRVAVGPELRLGRTFSRGLEFDGTSVEGTVLALVRLARTLTVSSTARAQYRHYTSRLATLDEEDIALVGAACNWAPGGSGWSLSGRWSKAFYHRPDGNYEDSQRVEIGVSFGFGNSRTSDRALPRSAVQGRPAASAPDGVLVFVVPDVEAVSVIGDFNHWDPSANPAEQISPGTWRVRLDVDPGTYQFLLMVDGEPVFPPGWERSVDDGFGGLNAVIVVGDDVASEGPR